MNWVIHYWALRPRPWILLNELLVGYPIGRRLQETRSIGKVHGLCCRHRSTFGDLLSRQPDCPRLRYTYTTCKS
jgi:hypothetical protein